MCGVPALTVGFGAVEAGNQHREEKVGKKEVEKGLRCGFISGLARFKRSVAEPGPGRGLSL